MSNRILIKMSAHENSISFRTITRKRKSPHCFYVLRSELERLWRDGCVVSHDIHSFAELRYDPVRGVVSITFTWLSSAGNEARVGWEQTVRLPRDKLAEFMDSSLEGSGAKQWQALSVEDMRRPRLVFNARDNLHAALSNKTVRCKLARFLRDHFNWPRTDQICFYNDSVPYSFFFREFRADRPGICGAVILHNQEDMSKAHYAIHT